MFSRSAFNMTTKACLHLSLVAGAIFWGTINSQASDAKSDDLVVKYDQSKLVRLPRAVSEIIVGNPSIADVAVHSRKVLIITGKSFGITNIIAIDNEKKIIQDQRIVVQREQIKTVNVQKGLKRESYNCSTQCNPTITVGDHTAYLESTAKSSKLKMGLSESKSTGRRR